MAVGRIDGGSWSRAVVARKPPVASAAARAIHLGSREIAAAARAVR